MPNHASATLIGHLGRDPETRNTQAGKVIFSATLAVGSGFGDNKITTWWKVNAFGKTAETLERFNLAKGSAVGFTGEPCLRPWTDKDGNERQSLELNANGFILLGEKDGERPAQKSAPAAKPVKAVADAPFDDEIPF